MASTPKTYADLPDDVLDFLSDPSANKFAADFVGRFGLDAGRKADLLALFEDLTLGTKDFLNLPKILETDFGVESTDSVRAAVDIATARLLPIEGVVGDVATQILSWGGSKETVTASGGVSARVKPEVFIRAVVNEAGLQIPDKVLTHRLELIAISYLKEARTRDQTLGALTRPKKLGGMQMQPADAATFLDLIEERSKALSLDFGEDIAPKKKPVEKKPAPKPKRPVMTDIKKPAKPAPAPKMPKPPAPPVMPKPPVAKEPAPKMPMPPKPAPAPKAEAPKPTKSKKEKVPAAPLHPSDKNNGHDVQVPPWMRKKGLVKEEKREEKKEPVSQQAPAKQAPKEIASPTVSAPRKTPPAPQQPKPLKQEKRTPGIKPIGGASKDDLLNGDDEKELAAAKAKADQLRAETNDPKSDIDKLVEKILVTAQIGLKGDQKKRFAAAVESRVREVRNPYETRAQLEDVPEKGGVGLKGSQLAEASRVIEDVVASYKERLAKTALEQKNDHVARETFAKQAQSARAPRVGYMQEGGAGQVNSKLDSLERQAANMNPGEMKQAVVASKAPPKAMATGAGKPRMDDVRGSRRLVGPVEEIRTLSLTDFRRLSKDANAAKTKVLDKVALLESQGFDQRVAALKAWRESPLQQQYVTISREALMNGKTVPALLDEKRAAGEDVPTQQELEAIMALNATLRF